LTSGGFRVVSDTLVFFRIFITNGTIYNNNNNSNNNNNNNNNFAVVKFTRFKLILVTGTSMTIDYCSAKAAVAE